MLDSERLYVDLLFRASKKYASWDPEVKVEVGDWGRITTGHVGLAFWRRARGTFLKEGNIYKDGKAEKYGIPDPVEYGQDATEGVTWMVSQNAEELDASADVAGKAPALAECKVKAAFKFSSGRGAVLVMEKDTITTIDPPGSLRRLLDEEKMLGLVVVSQVHRCSSYARLLTAQSGGTVAIGLSAKPPAVASASADASWVRSTNAGNFKSRVDKTGDRIFYPLFRLVSLKDQDVSSGMRDELEAGDPPLPDAVPPWQTEEDHDTSAQDARRTRRFRFSFHSR